MITNNICNCCPLCRCGDVKRVIMGLDRFKKTPCGFCFVEYYERLDAEHSMAWVNGTKLDDRIIRTDWDAGEFSFWNFVNFSNEQQQQQSSLHRIHLYASTLIPLIR